MSDMVERIAVALWHDRYPDLVWDQAPDVAREYYRGHARVAIEAMREPTGGMQVAAWDEGPSATAKDIWEAMIDEMLK